MEAVEFLNEKWRMCNSYKSSRDLLSWDCYKCELSWQNNKHDVACSAFVWEWPEEAVRIVENWAKAHHKE